MTLVLCPECGEETLEQMIHCPLCDEQLIDKEKKDKEAYLRLVIFGAAFVSGLAAATLCNILGYTLMAMAFAGVGLISLAVLLVKLNTTQ